MTTLTGATAQVRDAAATLTYETDGPLPEQGYWTLSTTFIDGPDGPIVQLGFKMVDGALAAVFAFDHVSVGQRNYDGVAPQVSGQLRRSATVIEAGFAWN
ncbi:hypothetical protein [Pedococcus sp. 5OH_020]|uniref:hypothetical protein n=1 Tax=Pedococcus sp. 5OH_020 TaxID=2989814 RepID=UPI0022E9F2B4|nr:hypothetical protein [Pedococcus sp. 5OH_020]